MTYELTHFAETQLIDILDYVHLEFGEFVASRISKQIEKDIILLSENPRLGKSERFLYQNKYEIRSLAEKHLKIFYYVNAERNALVVLNFFDTRQNPERIETNLIKL